jgi:SAM-dependent methyltransferase
MAETKTATLKWYNANADAFAAGADGVDLVALRAPFIAELAPGAHVLDLGCGSGRDALAFEREGFRVTALEPSDALATRVEGLIRGAVLRTPIEALDLDAVFDGVWACASLLHVPRAETPDALSRVFRALVPGGVFYASYKRGEGERWEGGRFFNDQTEESLDALLAAVGFERLRRWETRDARPERADTFWVNALARRPLHRVV